MKTPNHRKAAAGHSRRVLVVEDELLVAMSIEDMARELGYSVVEIAPHADDAMARISSCDADVAVVDIQLAGKAVEALIRRGIPCVFTSYGATRLPANYRNIPILQKPFGPSALARVLARCCANDNTAK